jgi:hypothetical protein
MSVRDIEFQEAIRRASERYGKHKRAVQQIWRRAEDSPTYALSTARELAVKTRYWRRRGRRYLYQSLRREGSFSWSRHHLRGRPAGAFARE